MGQGSQTFQGAAGGAMAGGAVGGPIGAAVGGVLGGVAGYFGGGGSSAYEDQLKKLAAGYGKRTAPQAGPAAQAGNSAFRTNQAGLIAQLEAMARGQGPSAATMMMREAMDKASSAQASGAAGAGGRGVNAGAALRNASNNTMAIQSQGARDAGLMRVNEQLGATSQLGQAVAQGRMGDENTSQFNATQQNTTSANNLQAKLQMLGLNDKAQLEALMGAMGTAGPGLGTQIMAGGATMMPQMLQYNQQQSQLGLQQQALAQAQAQARAAQPPTPAQTMYQNQYGVKF